LPYREIATDTFNRNMLEASLDPLVSIGLDGKITDLNPATEAVTGRARDMLIGMDFSDCFTDPGKARAGYEQVLLSGFVRDYPLEIRHADGHLTSVVYNAYLYRDQNGAPVGVFAAARDCTARLKAEEALRQSEQRFTSMLESVRDYAIIFLDLDGRVATWNKGAERLKGYQADEIVGQHFSKFYTPEDLAKRKPEQELKVARSEGRFEDEDWRVRNDGTRFWANVVITTLLNASGQVTGFVKITRDLTARKQAEDQIRRYAEDLKRSNKELEHFAYVASHDLQEPLRTISSFSQLLARRYQGKLDTDADEFIAYIVEGATRMQTLINDLLAFSRIGTRGSSFAPVDGDVILRTAVANLETTINECGAVITHDPLPILTADRTQLTQLFQNLFANAIKFRRVAESPRIHVSAELKDGAWHFGVHDNGIGIDSQFFERIFVIFQRLHGREEYPGTGIGLAICRKIVERHGGRMWVESEPGAGSTFHFTIPEKGNHDELNATG
jgi:PAS domain S-box-containing protein